MNQYKLVILFLCETPWSGLQRAALWLVAFDPFYVQPETTKVLISRKTPKFNYQVQES